MDAGIDCRLTWQEMLLLPAPRHVPDDVVICGDVYAFLVLMTRQEDPDSLFFRRRLQLTGDTELGLHLKNFLDALDPDELPVWIQRLMPRFAATYYRLMA